MSLPDPYYSDGSATIYVSPCEDVLPYLKPESVDLVLTDPPYPDYYTDVYAQTGIGALRELHCRQLVFWSAKAGFPLDHTAVHIWDKKTGCGSEYERIFERNGSKNYKVFRHYLINSTVAATLTGDAFTGHPSQKPIKLVAELVAKFCPFEGLVLDPFMGSGTTLLAAKNLGRKAIGIEIHEPYAEIAARRLAQEVLPLEVFS